LGGQAVVSEGSLAASSLTSLEGFSAALWWGDANEGRALAQALADRDGEIVQLITAMPDVVHVAHERHLCVDTTAAGGNAALLAG
jgi:RHH-type proline utilization regulon transcriptional repressor/proline dehydrogenase/delta 1-pyrroline-5-carboxylate dehydrogenase